MFNHICWNITLKCNMACKFCYRLPEIKELSLKDNLYILDNLIDSNVKKISWTGGESLIYKDLIKLMQYANNKGIENTLISNGILLNEKRLNEISGCISNLTIPIDTIYEPVRKELYRQDNHYNKIINILEYIKSSNQPYKVKVNSILTKANIEEIIVIASVLAKYQSILMRWKIFKFFPFREAIKLNSILSISDEDYKRVKEILLKKELGINIYFNDEETIQNDYVIIRPDGLVNISRDTEDIVIGDLKKERFDTITKVL